MYRILGLLSILFIGVSATQAQQTHIVDLAGTGDFVSIHAAVAAAATGDTIRVQPDQYAFTADLGPVSVDKRLYIIGSGYMPVEDGGTELVDIPGTGYFDLTGSADGTVIKGFRINGGADFIDSESGTSGVTIEENLIIGGGTVINLQGSADTVRSNIFLETNHLTVYLQGTNTQLVNNIFARTNASGVNQNPVYIEAGTGVVVAYNFFVDRINIYRAIWVQGGAPEIFSNGFADYTPAIGLIFNQSGTSAFSTNNGFYATGNQEFGLNTVTGDPTFVNFDPDNEDFDLEFIDENTFDLTLDTGSAWIDQGRTGTPYLDTNGSRSDIGSFAGPTPFSGGRGAPSVPVVIQFQVTPTTVSPSGTITITATGRIGDDG